MSTKIKTEDRPLTTGQVAALFGTKSETVAVWADRGVVPHFRTPGGHRRFPAAELRALAAVTPARNA